MNYYKYTFPSIVFLHCGIVDCAPRAFKKVERKVLQKLRIISLFKPFLYYMRKYRKITFTPISLFEKNILHFHTIFENAPEIYVIGILPISGDYEKKVFGITKNRQKYNEILKKYNYIDNENFPKSGILDDYHHLSEEGHQIIFDKTQKIIKNI